MSEPVYVTGIGTISAIGNNVAESFDALTSYRSGIGEISILETNFQEKLPVAEVKYTEKELNDLGETRNKHLFTRTELLGIIAVKEALRDAGITDFGNKRMGFISANSVGGMGSTELLYAKYINESGPAPYIPLIEQHGCGECTERIAEMVGLKGFVTTINTACSSSANAIMLGARLIKRGMCDIVVAGGVDALTKFTLNGFNSLMILDKEPCRPFDDTRRGLNLGEGAGFIVLESSTSAKKNNRKIYCRLSGYGNANDAFHQTASSPEGEGASLAMSAAFKVSGLQPKDIDYINAHGTGTEINDLSEGTALKRLFENKVPAFSSTKAFTGHTLGASGGIEAVYSVLAIDRNFIFPNLHWNKPIADLDLVPVTRNIEGVKVHHVLSNSFGFGGNTSSLIFSSVNE